MKSVTFDSHAILKFAQDERGADRVEELLRAAEKAQVRAYVNEINLGEVYSITMRRLGAESARRFLDQFSTLTVERVAATWEVIESAAELKARHALSYADCFAAATALKHGASIVTGDPEFKKVEHLVPIEWI
ncbi:MAG TPA: type II toxin-antitoxin system VapC family toxin [Syntrophobacteraceae bacterium]|nr:type II toxin-antitoxin system VapC family toxin [Syntrophobacteraceae bacterium]